MNNPKIYTLFSLYQNYEGHPEVHTHEEMANRLINFIDKNNLFN